MGTLRSIKALLPLIAIAMTMITSRILGVRMRRRTEKTAGTEVENEMELASLETGMQVEPVEERNRGGKL